jgi:hypothetical protein
MPPVNINPQAAHSTSNPLCRPPASTSTLFVGTVQQDCCRIWHMLSAVLVVLVVHA